MKGDSTLEGNRVPSGAGQAAVEAAYGQRPHDAVHAAAAQGAPGQTQIGDSYTFNALDVSRSFNVETTNATSWSVKLKISGLPVVTLWPDGLWRSANTGNFANASTAV
jgi:hypothetical protein